MIDNRYYTPQTLFERVAVLFVGLVTELRGGLTDKLVS